MGCVFFTTWQASFMHRTPLVTINTLERKKYIFYVYPSKGIIVCILKHKVLEMYSKCLLAMQFCILFQKSVHSLIRLWKPMLQLCPFPVEWSPSSPLLSLSLGHPAGKTAVGTLPHGGVGTTLEDIHESPCKR